MPPQRPARLLWVMFLAYFTYGMMYVQAALTPDIIKDYHLSRFSAGLLGSALFLAMALFAIPSGLLMDRLGARRVILSGVSLMGLGCLMVSRSHSYTLVLATVFAVGIGAVMLVTSVNPLIQQLDAAQNYHRNLNFTIAWGTFGGFLAIFLLAYLRGMGRPWQSYYLWWAVVCLVLLAFLAPSRFPPRPQDAEEIRLDQIGKLLCNPILLTYLLGIYLYAAAEIGTYYWIPKFFEDVHGVPAAASNASAVTFMGRVFPSLPAFVCALFFAMQGVGRVLGGAALNKFGTRRVMRFCSVMALASLLVAIFGPKYVSAVGFAACGLFTSVLGPLIFSGTINSLSEFHGTISGLFCANPLAGALVSPFEGWVGDHIGMRTAMLIPALCLTYVVGLAMLGRAKYE